MINDRYRQKNKLYSIVSRTETIYKAMSAQKIQFSKKKENSIFLQSDITKK